MHTKPISTEVIASYKATLTSGFAEVLFEESKFVVHSTEQKSTPYWQKMVDALNLSDYHGSSPMIMTDEFEKFPYLIEDLPHMQALFEAVVAYPLVLKTLKPTKTMVQWLQHLIMKQFCCMNLTLDKKQLGLMNATLNKYFASVDDQHKDSIDEECPDLKSLFESIKNDKLFGDARKILPSSCDMFHSYNPESSVEENDSHMISPKNHCHEDLNFSRSDQVNLQPFHRIVAKIEREQDRKMTEEENDLLIYDLIAAKRFYEVLRQSEQAERSENEKPFSDRIIESIEEHLASIRSMRVVRSKRILKYDPIYRYLFKFHLVEKLWQAMPAFIRIMGEVHEQSLERAFDLFNFCRALYDEEILDENQVVFFNEVIRILQESPSGKVFQGAEQGLEHDK